jgi:hypothetical protein
VDLPAETAPLVLLAGAAGARRVAADVRPEGPRGAQVADGTADLIGKRRGLEAGRVGRRRGDDGEAVAGGHGATISCGGRAIKGGGGGGI